MTCYPGLKKSKQPILYALTLKIILKNGKRIAAAYIVKPPKRRKVSGDAIRLIAFRFYINFHPNL